MGHFGYSRCWWKNFYHLESLSLISFNYQCFLQISFFMSSVCLLAWTDDHIMWWKQVLLHLWNISKGICCGFPPEVLPVASIWLQNTEGLGYKNLYHSTYLRNQPARSLFSPPSLRGLWRGKKFFWVWSHDRFKSLKECQHWRRNNNTASLQSMSGVVR